MAGSSGGGGGGGKKKARIEIIPLIDVIFFLLATFVLFTLSLNKTSGVRVELPKAVTAETRDPSASVTISVLADGGVAWNDGVIGLDDLVQRIQAWGAATNKEGKILLNADAESRFSQVFGYVLSEVRKAGFKKVLIETKVAPKSA
jgi:biopolymer transport protein ExbD